MKKKLKKETPETSMALYELQAKICSALSHPLRLYILDLLDTDEKTSTELLEVLKIPKANLSQHLSVLKDAGILRSRKDGLYQYFSLVTPKIKEACSMVRSILHEKMAQEEKLHTQLMKELSLKG